MSASKGGDESVGLSDIGASNASIDISSSKTWRTMIDVSIAKSRKIRGGNYVQIATVDPASNEPRCRTVVFRGFLNLPKEHSDRVECDEKPCVMKMITDNRSNKVAEAMGHPKQPAEMVWWFSKSSEQYRIRGKLRFIGDSEEDKVLSSARKQQWGNLSDAAREQFFWEEPGVTFSGDSKVPTGGRDENGKVLSPPQTFLLMLLFPTRVHYLRLGDNFAQIDECTDGEWTNTRVNP